MNATFFKSDCGKYLCRSLGDSGYEAWTVDGTIHWRNDNRIKKWADEKKYIFPMVFSVGGYSCKQPGQKEGSFTLTLLHCDTNKEIIPGKGNTIIEQRQVVFRRRVPDQNVPVWLRGGHP